MATKFTKGQIVRVTTVVPKGPVVALHMNSDGEFTYQIEWTDVNGQTQTRWFSEDDLTGV
jgi:hypothetical protein